MFNILNECERKKEEILELQNIKAPTFHKNLQKLKLAGFEIKKKNNFYFLNKYKNILFLDECEKSTIAYMLNFARKNLAENKYNSFFNLIKKLLILTDKKNDDDVIKKFRLIEKYSLIEETEEKITQLENYIKEQETLKITLRSNKLLKIIPLKIEENKKKLYLICKNIIKHKEEKINIKDIIIIEKYFERDYIQSEHEIIFELSGYLAKRYVLKKNERIVKNKKDSIIVAINTKDKESLFKRLLRYDTSCKILFPKLESEMFAKLIDKAIINIGI